jgi:hypothetical protein
MSSGDGLVKQDAIQSFPMDEKRIPVSFRVSPRFKNCLKMAAEHERRSQTNFIEKLVFDYCQRERLEPASPGKQRVVKSLEKNQK